MSSTSSPMLLVTSRTRSSSSSGMTWGMPRTHRAPRMGPATEPRPPMMAVATTTIDSPARNSESGCSEGTSVTSSPPE